MRLLIQMGGKCWEKAKVIRSSEIAPAKSRWIQSKIAFVCFDMFCVCLVVVVVPAPTRS
jgi:hypothetical protein